MEEVFIPYVDLEKSAKKKIDSYYETTGSGKKRDPEQFYYHILLVAYINNEKEDEIDKILKALTSGNPDFIKKFFEFILGKKSLIIRNVIEIDYRILLPALKEFTKFLAYPLSYDLNGQDTINDDIVLKILDTFLRMDFDSRDQMVKKFTETYTNEKGKSNIIEIKGSEKNILNSRPELQTIETLCTSTKEQKEIKDNSEELARIKELEENNESLKNQLAKTGAERYKEREEIEKLNKKLLEKEEELKVFDKELKEKDETIKSHMKTIRDEKINYEKSIKENEEFKKRIEEKDDIIKEKEESINQLELENKQTVKNLEDAEIEIKEKGKQLEVSNKRIETIKETLNEQNKLIEDIKTQQDIYKKTIEATQQQGNSIQQTFIIFAKQANDVIEQLRRQNIMYLQQAGDVEKLLRLQIRSNAEDAIRMITSNHVYDLPSLYNYQRIIEMSYPRSTWPPWFIQGFSNYIDFLKNRQFQITNVQQSQYLTPSQVYRLPGPQPEEVEEEVIPLRRLVESQDTRKEPNITVTEVDETKEDENKEELKKDKKEEEWVPTQRMDEPVEDKKVESIVIEKHKDEVETKKPKTTVSKNFRVRPLNLKKESKSEEVKKQKGETKDDPIIVVESQIIAEKETDEQPTKKLESTGKFPVEKEAKMNDLEQLRDYANRVAREELKTQRKELKEEKELVDDLIIEEYFYDIDGKEVGKYSYFPERKEDKIFNDIENNLEVIMQDPDFKYIRDNIEEFQKIYRKEEKDVSKLRKKWVFNEIVNYVINKYKLKGSSEIKYPLSLPHDLLWILINYKKEIYKLTKVVITQKMYDPGYNPSDEEAIYLFPDSILDSSILKIINDPNFKLIFENGRIFEENITLHNMFKEYFTKDYWLFRAMVDLGAFFIKHIGIDAIIENPPYKMLPFLMLVEKYPGPVFSILESEIKDPEEIERIKEKIRKIVEKGRINELIKKAEESYKPEYSPNKEILRDKIFMDIENATEKEIIDYIRMEDAELFFIGYGERFIEDYKNYQTRGTNFGVGIWMFDQVLKFIRQNIRNIISDPKNYKKPKYIFVIMMLHLYQEVIYQNLIENGIKIDKKQFTNVVNYLKNYEEEFKKKLNKKE